MATIVWETARAMARKTQRLFDLKCIQSGLELCVYYIAHNVLLPYGEFVVLSYIVDIFRICANQRGVTRRHTHPGICLVLA